MHLQKSEERWLALDSLVRQLVPDPSISVSASHLAAGYADHGNGQVTALKPSPKAVQRMAPSRPPETEDRSALSPNNVPHTTGTAFSTVSQTASLDDLLSASREITAKYRQPDAPGLAHDLSHDETRSGPGLLSTSPGSLDAGQSVMMSDIEISSSLGPNEFEAAMQRANSFLHGMCVCVCVCVCMSSVRMYTHTRSSAQTHTLTHTKVGCVCITCVRVAQDYRRALSR